ncbi:TetR/AcrR family transcriptional regulator [Nocardiopsis trehalosi]|uniref:TetR/AcrR family transcriptional regulator n=1 Tax=Nocardiopsis trehalosi TaxID=109329 RepID=UPI00082B6080|nr:TetR/AcrR family transcriptional regulator [Nocardiopsis trehalosi]
MSEADRPGARRPGGRTARTRAAVVRATLDELAERGFTDMTVEGVAARSGVHRTTVYRRWGGVPELVADALGAAADDDWRPADTGDVEEDLRRIALDVVHGFTTAPDRAVPAAAISAAFHADRAAEALRGFFAERHRRCAEVVARGVERGQLPVGTDPAEVVRTAVAPIYYRLFVSREPVDAGTAARAAAAAVAAARAGALPAQG